MSKEHYDEIMERHVKTLAQNMKAHAAESHRMQDEAIKLILKQAEKRMNKGPKRIYVDVTPDEFYHTWDTEKSQIIDDEVVYVREDLVLGLVEALNECLKVEGYKNAREMIEAALKKLEKE